MGQVMVRQVDEGMAKPTWVLELEDLPQWHVGGWVDELPGPEHLVLNEGKVAAGATHHDGEDAL